MKATKELKQMSPLSPWVKAIACSGNPASFHQQPHDAIPDNEGIIE